MGRTTGRSPYSMLKTNNLVRKMHACETMGATTVICTDKTGTLTQNKMQVKECTFGKLTPELAEGIAVNSTASLDFSESQPRPIGNPTEGALLLWLHTNKYDYRRLKEASNTKNEIPFSTERKYMSTTVFSAVTNREVTYTKGAPEIVFGMCDSSDIDEVTLKESLQKYQDSAYRTLGFAIDKHFVGVVAIEDPVREDVPDAVKECMNAGIMVKIVTGDTPGTAKQIGREIGLWADADTDRNIITGTELAELSDEKLQECVLDLKIIARARPMDKKRLVEALQARNQVVAVTGDGTNDAPALHQANVGLSMGAGTAVAKEASDITIIDNSFSSIGKAVMWGRSLYKNIQRFLLFQLTVNVTACCIVFVGALVGKDSPLTVTQMLWINLIMDTFGAMALASLPPSKDVMKDKPRKRGSEHVNKIGNWAYFKEQWKLGAFIINKPMLGEILSVGIFFFVLLFAFLLIFQHADINSMTDFLNIHFSGNGEVSHYEQTLLFSIFVWTHFFYLFNARAFETGESVLLNLFSKKFWSKGFWTIVCVIVFGQLLISIIVYNLMRVQRLKYELREEAIQKRSLELLNIEKQRFFSNISHELKTPLTLILAPITVLSERFLLDIDVKEKLAIIKRQAKKMLNLIELSHELQLNERNMLKVKPCMFSFNKFLKDITEDFMFMAKYDNKDFVVNYPNKNVNVYADYSMIEQMLNNLLTNSFKHTVQRDKVGIDISYHDQLLTIKVYDTGDGISEKDLPYIFDRFYQASNQGLKNIGGTGIGLAFTKRLIELHSGNIGVESKLGEGSTFTVNLPIIQNVTEADVIDETNEQEGETDLYVGDWDIKSIEIDSKYLRFLVYLVEDNTEMRSFLTEIIGQFFTVKSFANGKECLDGMNKEWPDIIVSDVMMPEMDGNELCNVIKSDLKTSHIPVILLTACNTVDDKIKGLQSGADAYIPKPFYPKHVLTRICTLLDNRAKLWERFQSGVPLNIAANENEVSAKDNEFICALYAKFNEYVDDECVDMELLAKEIGVNRSLFFQKVKALTNDSPFELLKNYRLQRAAELLVKEEYNVNEVCMMTGFKSRTHFSRLFKEKYGVAPSKYKESVVNRI